MRKDITGRAVEVRLIELYSNLISKFLEINDIKKLHRDIDLSQDLRRNFFMVLNIISFILVKVL